ncbi:MAG TPA: NUDIX domain-containing protein [Solirubrobacteraceae bacterium]|nr:NUDIX domain-containing protein [Solirubrobacteraceae bacterium]
MVRPPLPQAEFDAIFSRVPRLTVEAVILDPDRGVLLNRRDIEPCIGLWHLPGGTVRFGEPVVDAVARVARAELGIAVRARELLGYIEYPSHYLNGLDSPVGLAFAAEPLDGSPDAAALPGEWAWFTRVPEVIHPEQAAFLRDTLGLP